jgi:hypothetical protein
MTWEARLKTLGYLVSTLSVICLGVVAWDGAREKPLLFVLLLAGIATSIGGMLLRWIALLVKQQEDKAREARTVAEAKQEVQNSLNLEGSSAAATARRR